MAETEKRLAAGESFARESAFSGKTIMESMSDAKAAGFRVEVIFVAVQDVEEAIARVQQRAERGGHSIPEVEQRRRFDLTIQNAATAARVADSVRLFQNPAGRGPQQVARIDRGSVVQLEASRSAWVDRVIDGLDRDAELADDRGPGRKVQPPVRLKRDRDEDLER